MVLASLLLAAAVALVSCDGGKGREDEEARDDRGGPAETRREPAEQVGADSVTAYVVLREMGYAALEPVPMKLVVRNETARTLCFTFPTAQRFDFIIGKQREPVWSWSDGRMFAQTRGRLAVAPGESIYYEYTWDGRLAGGKLPRLGRYRARGALMTAPPIETEERQFGIVD
jgi:hypothetical protein